MFQGFDFTKTLIKTSLQAESDSATTATDLFLTKEVL